MSIKKRLQKVENIIKKHANPLYIINKQIKPIKEISSIINSKSSYWKLYGVNKENAISDGIIEIKNIIIDLAKIYNKEK